MQIEANCLGRFKFNKNSFKYKKNFHLLRIYQDSHFISADFSFVNAEGSTGFVFKKKHTNEQPKIKLFS